MGESSGRGMLWVGHAVCGALCLSQPNAAPPPHPQLCSKAPGQGLAQHSAGLQAPLRHHSIKAKLRDGGDGNGHSEASRLSRASAGGGGGEGSAGFRMPQTQSTFERGFCTEPEIADSWGNPSLLLPLLLKHNLKETVSPRRLLAQITAGKVPVLHFSSREGKNSQCQAQTPSPERWDGRAPSCTASAPAEHLHPLLPALSCTGCDPAPAP